MNRRRALELIATAPLALAVGPVQGPRKLSAIWYEDRRITVRPGSLYDFLLSAHGPFERGPLSDVPINTLSPEEIRKLFRSRA